MTNKYVFFLLDGTKIDLTTRKGRERCNRYLNNRIGDLAEARVAKDRRKAEAALRVITQVEALRRRAFTSSMPYVQT